MNKSDYVAYLQDEDGNESDLNITEPDPADGSICIHLPDGRWVRLVRTEPVKQSTE